MATTTAPKNGTAEASDDAAKRAALAAGAQAGVEGARAYANAQDQIRQGNAAALSTLQGIAGKFNANGADPMLTSGINLVTNSRLGAIQQNAADYAGYANAHQAAIGGYMDAAKSSLATVRAEAQRAARGSGGGGGRRSGGGLSSREIGLAALRSIAGMRDSKIKDLIASATNAVAQGKTAQQGAQGNLNLAWDPVYQQTLLGREADAAAHGIDVGALHQDSALQKAFWDAHPRLQGFVNAARQGQADPTKFGLTEADLKQYGAFDANGNPTGYMRQWYGQHAKELRDQAGHTRNEQAWNAITTGNPSLTKFKDYLDQQAAKQAQRDKYGYNTDPSTYSVTAGTNKHGVDERFVERAVALGKAAGLSTADASRLALARVRASSIGTDRRGAYDEWNKFALDRYQNTIRDPQNIIRTKVGKGQLADAMAKYQAAALAEQQAQTIGTMPFGDYAVQVGQQMGLPPEALAALNDPALQNAIEKQYMANLPKQVKPSEAPASLSAADIAKMGLTPQDVAAIQQATIPQGTPSLAFTDKDGKPVSTKTLASLGVQDFTDPNDPVVKQLVGAGKITYAKDAKGNPVMANLPTANALNYYLSQASQQRQGPSGGSPLGYEQFLQQLANDPNFKPRGKKAALLSDAFRNYLAAQAAGYWADQNWQPMSTPQWWFQNTYGSQMPQIPSMG